MEKQTNNTCTSGTQIPLAQDNLAKQMVASGVQTLLSGTQSQIKLCNPERKYISDLKQQFVKYDYVLGRILNKKNHETNCEFLIYDGFESCSVFTTLQEAAFDAIELHMVYQISICKFNYYWGGKCIHADPCFKKIEDQNLVKKFKFNDDINKIDQLAEGAFVGVFGILI